MQGIETYRGAEASGDRGRKYGEPVSSPRPLAGSHLQTRIPEYEEFGKKYPELCLLSPLSLLLVCPLAELHQR